MRSFNFGEILGDFCCFFLFFWGFIFDHIVACILGNKESWVDLLLKKSMKREPFYRKQPFLCILFHKKIRKFIFLKFFKPQIFSVRKTPCNHDFKTPKYPKIFKKIRFFVEILKIIPFFLDFLIFTSSKILYSHYSKVLKSPF